MQQTLLNGYQHCRQKLGQNQFSGSSLAGKNPCHCHFQGAETKIREGSGSERFMGGVGKGGFWMRGGGTDDDDDEDDDGATSKG